MRLTASRRTHTLLSSDLLIVFSWRPPRVVRCYSAHYGQQWQEYLDPLLHFSSVICEFDLWICASCLVQRDGKGMGSRFPCSTFLWSWVLSSRILSSEIECSSKAQNFFVLTFLELQKLHQHELMRSSWSIEIPLPPCQEPLFIGNVFFLPQFALWSTALMIFQQIASLVSPHFLQSDLQSE